MTTSAKETKGLKEAELRLSWIEWKETEIADIGETMVHSMYGQMIHVHRCAHVCMEPVIFPFSDATQCCHDKKMTELHFVHQFLTSAVADHS